MKLLFCVICGTNKNIHHHHIIPKSRGGTDDHTNFISLCSEHHAMIHQLRPGTWNDQKELIKKGVERAKEDGVKFGRKPLYEHLIPEIKYMRENGWGLGTIGKKLDVHRSAIQRICKKENIFPLKGRGGTKKINVNKIIEFAEKGHGATQISKIMHINRDSIYRLIPDFATKYPRIKNKKEVKYRKQRNGQFLLPLT